MFISRFVVKNFMIHRNTALRLDPISVFVGPNNGGKSALFDALLNFSMVSRGRLGQAFGPGPYSFRSKMTHGAGRVARVGFEVDMSESVGGGPFLTYNVSYAQIAAGADAPRYQIFDERLVASDGTVHFDRSDPDGSRLAQFAPHVRDDQSIFAAIRRAQFLGEQVDIDPLVAHVTREVSRIGKFRLSPQLLSQPSRLPDVTAAAPTSSDGTPEAPSHVAQSPSLDYGGEGLSSVLYFLSETGSPVLEEVVAQLRTTVVGFDGFDFNMVGTDRVGFSAKFDDARDIVQAANLSDGTLSLIGLSVLLANPSRLPVLCIEEPENGLTPNSTRMVYRAMRAVAFPPADVAASQILISSHSPHVICEAWNGDDRHFIFQIKPEGGRAVVLPFTQVIESQGLHLEKGPDGKRGRLNLNVANEVMDGYLGG